jgi:AAA15 family ATPase/GTPase
MKISLKNLGAIRQAEFELGKLTIICGGNNTGKTYATYALFGFLTFWREAFEIDASEKEVKKLLNEGSIELDLKHYLLTMPEILAAGSKEYTKQLPLVFASAERYFSKAEFKIEVDSGEINLSQPFERVMGTAKNQLFTISKNSNSSIVTISLVVEKQKIRISEAAVSQTIGAALKDIIFSEIFPKPFIASAERTGAAIFRKELNFARNRLLEEMSSMQKDINPFELLSKVYADYALPVKSNVDFTRQLEDLVKTNSYLAKEHPEVINKFADIIGGEYLVTRNDELYFVPKGTKVKLTMDESSSAVRSFLDIGFYLRHVAEPGDLLIIDEPELNLHPENQRRVARLFARLVNLGIKVFITTHSDYIIKELNTLIMLNRPGQRLSAIAREEGYEKSELLNADGVRVYIAEEALVKLDGGSRKTRCQTLVAAQIDSDFGIDARSFDKTISDMNRVQEEIIWGGDI